MVTNNYITATSTATATSVAACGGTITAALTSTTCQVLLLQIHSYIPTGVWWHRPLYTGPRYTCACTGQGQ